MDKKEEEGTFATGLTGGQDNKRMGIEMVISRGQHLVKLIHQQRTCSANWICLSLIPYDLHRSYGDFPARLLIWFRSAPRWALASYATSRTAIMVVTVKEVGISEDFGPKYKDKIAKVLEKHADLFSPKHGRFNDGIVMPIHFKDKTNFSGLQQRAYRLTLHDREAVDAILDPLREGGQLVQAAPWTPSDPPGEAPPAKGTSARQPAFRTWKVVVTEWNPFTSLRIAGPTKGTATARLVRVTTNTMMDISTLMAGVKQYVETELYSAMAKARAKWEEDVITTTLSTACFADLGLDWQLKLMRGEVEAAHEITKLAMAKIPNPN
ncbi:hypothetical protein FQN57_004332 [Myotisia sp. PD_48]|nr:hypothetical protein FQN57_004332 [Myotisia sp. PD_48]